MPVNHHDQIRRCEEGLDVLYGSMSEGSDSSEARIGPNNHFPATIMYLHVFFYRLMLHNRWILSELACAPFARLVSIFGHFFCQSLPRTYCCGPGEGGIFFLQSPMTSISSSLTAPGGGSRKTARTVPRRASSTNMARSRDLTMMMTRHQP